MLNVCPDCRDMSLEKAVRPDAAPDGAATAVCPTCGTEFRFPYRPLFTLEGAPGVGKSTTAGLIDDEVPLAVYEGDHYIDLVGGTVSWDAVCELGLRIGMTLHASGRQALYAGGVYPHDLAESPETRYFPSVERCALACTDADLETRLRERPYFRENPERIDEHLSNNRWYRERGRDAGVRVVNTTELDPETVADRVENWVAETLAD